MTVADALPVAVGQSAIVIRERKSVAPFSSGSVTKSVKTSATKTKFSATPKRQRKQAVTVAENLEVFVSDDDLLSQIRAGRVRVHKHGSGKYKGDYLALRPSGGRKEKRPFLASGKPEKLKDYLLNLGVYLCLTHRELAPDRCPKCGGN